MGLKEMIKTAVPSVWHRMVLIRRRIGIYWLYCRLFAKMAEPEHLRVFLSNRFSGKNIYFYPDQPYWKHIIAKACMFLGYGITSDPKRSRVASFFWLPGTFVKDPAAKREGINSQCLDISKTRVMKVFEEVFGYGYGVDVRTHRGPCVKKSDQNAAHDGSLIEAPAQPEEGFVYQRLIENQISEDLTLDIRVPVIGGAIPFVLWKSRPIARRFMSDNLDVIVKRTEEMFSLDEIQKILRLCEQMDLDIGELDVLRDRNDGRIYVVDVNRCPFGPAPDTPKPTGARQVELTALRFQEFLKQN